MSETHALANESIYLSSLSSTNQTLYKWHQIESDGQKSPDQLKYSFPIQYNLMKDIRQVDKFNNSTNPLINVEIETYCTKNCQVELALLNIYHVETVQTY